MPAKKGTPVKKPATKIARGPAATVSRRPSSPSTSLRMRARRREPSVASPLRGASSLSAPVYSLLGRSTGTAVLPKEIFGAKINEPLLSQALRVYLNNQKGHFSSTKTRGEVKGSTRKLFKQKGTGRARHGSIRASIFIGGGIALGPKVRDINLELPKKMKKAALLSALSLKAKGGEIKVLSGLEKATGKTKEIFNLLGKLEFKSALIVDSGENIQRASRNLPKVKTISPENLNALEVIAFQGLVLTKESISKLESKLKEETK